MVFVDYNADTELFQGREGGRTCPGGMLVGVGVGGAMPPWAWAWIWARAC